MPAIPGLRSCYARVGRLVYFGRMLDKIRLHAAGKLPEGWRAARGTTNTSSFDSRCCRFLHIDYADLEAETLKGGADEELLTWAFVNGRKPTEEEIESVFHLTRVIYEAVLGLHYRRQEQKKSGQLAIF